MADITLSQEAVYKFTSTGSSEFQFTGGQNVPFQYDFLHSIMITSSQSPLISLKNDDPTSPSFIKMTSVENSGNEYEIQEAAGGYLTFHNQDTARYHFAISGSGVGNTRQTLFNSYIALDVQGTDPAIRNSFAHIYAKNDGGDAHVYVQDETGVVTRISPHNEEGDWEYFSRNKLTGKTIRINMEHFIKRMEEITGEVFIKYE
jgi:hypothetical protein